MDKERDWSWEYISLLDLQSKNSKYMMRRLGKYSGGVTHVNLTLPTYLVKHVEAWSSSKSLLITMIIEAYFRRVEQLDDGYPNLARLLANLLAMDQYVKKVKKEGHKGIDTDRALRAYRTYLRKILRKYKRRIEQMSGFEVGAARARSGIRDPHIVKRDDRRRRRQDAISKQEMGPEGYPEIEDKQELYRINKDLFKQIFPDLYTEWQAQDENKAEDNRQDPTDVEEDGADKPEDPVEN